ncbi:hypothetical protein NDN08_000525 [Rhodosorus marinus]|uniref:thiamine phosphate synthase n=1 Tax=Rhodosorus marinus TaxID=101924 RepID=A0AAV8UN62_9RHOD|nr:hypothetical protein NDN08_000525 [Rhodosorus marinus]
MAGQLRRVGSSRRSNCTVYAERPNMDYSLYLVTDRKLTKHGDVSSVVEAALDGGTSVVQLRDKDVSTREMIELGQELRCVTEQNGVPLLVNDRVDVALAIKADGVHVGQDDMPIEMVRKLIGADKIIGVSAGTIEEAVQAENDGADYLGVGAVYATSSKSDAGDAIGPEALKAIVDSVSIPVVAIGGINGKNARECITQGAAGVAVISAIVSADDPSGASSNLRQTILKTRSE